MKDQPAEGSRQVFTEKLFFFKDFLYSSFELKAQPLSLVNYFLGLGLLIAAADFFFILEYFAEVPQLRDRVLHAARVAVCFGCSAWVTEWWLVAWLPKRYQKALRKTIFSYLLSSCFAFFLGCLLYGVILWLTYFEAPSSLFLKECFFVGHLWLLNVLLIIHQKNKEQLAHDLKIVEEINRSLLKRIQIATKLSQETEELPVPPQITSQKTEAAMVPKAHTQESQKVTLSNGSATELIRVDDVTHVSSEGNYCRIYVLTAGESREIYVRMTLKIAKEKFASENIIQCHRSHLVNFQHILSIKKNQKWQIFVGKNGEYAIPVSRNRLPTILPMVQDFLKQEGNG